MKVYTVQIEQTRRVTIRRKLQYRAATEAEAREMAERKIGSDWEALRMPTNQVELGPIEE